MHRYLGKNNFCSIINEKIMKRLFYIGSGKFIFSLFPVLTWFILSAILQDANALNVFSLIYSIQFISTFFKSLFSTGANVRGNKKKDPNAVWNGIFWGTIFSVAVFTILLVYVNKYIEFFGLDVSTYRDYTIYGMGFYFLQTTFSFIIEKLYFEDKEKMANVHQIIFNVVNICLVSVLALCLVNKLLAFIITLCVLSIYVIVLYVREFNKFKINFSFIKNIRYDTLSLISSIFMCLIYFFGFRTVFSAGEEYLVAVNIVTLATDPQWDCLDAISTVVKVDLSKDRYQYKKELKNAYLYCFVVVLSSIIISFALAFAYGASIVLVVIYLAFQVVDMFSYPYQEILCVYTQIEYSPTISVAIDLSAKVVRTILATIIISPFCTDIAQLIDSLILMSICFVRMFKFKVVDGKMVLKDKRKVNNNINNVS